MFTASKTPSSQKRATDIANVMDIADDPSAVYTDTENRMQQRQRDIETAWAADPAWENAPDSVKTAMTLAADAAGGTANTGDLLSKAQAVQAEQNPDDKIPKQNSLADSVATLVGKKPASDDQSINFAALANNIANDRYSGDARGKDRARNNAARFTGDNSLHGGKETGHNPAANGAPSQQPVTHFAATITPSKSGSTRPADGPDIERLVLEANKHWPNAKIRITGRARTMGKQASLMTNLFLKDRKNFNNIYAARPHIQQMNDWVDANPNATPAQTKNAFETIIRAAVSNGARVSGHLSGNARDISIPKTNQPDIRSFLENSGVHVLDESSSKNGPHWHLDL